MRVATYLRVSTKDQSIAQQRKALKDLARARGWKIIKEFSDEGMSALKVDRPGYLKLMEAARKRQVDAVLVFKFDRFARSFKQLIDSLEEFRCLGVEFISYTENIDTSTPAGKAMFQMIATFAEFERSMISEATRARLKAMKNLGVKLGRPKTIDDQRVLDYANKYPKKSQRIIARALKVSLGTVNRILRPKRSPKMTSGTKKPHPKGVQKRGATKTR